MKTTMFRLVADSENGFAGISKYKSLLDSWVEDAITEYKRDGISLTETDFIFDIVSFREDVGKLWCGGYEDCLRNVTENDNVSIKFVNVERKFDYTYCDYSVNYNLTLPVSIMNGVIKSLMENKDINNIIKDAFSCKENSISYLSDNSDLWAEFMKTYVETGEDKSPYENIETYISYAVYYWLTYEKGINVFDYMWDYISDYMEFGNYVYLSEKGKEKISLQEK